MSVLDTRQSRPFWRGGRSQAQERPVVGNVPYLKGSRFTQSSVCQLDNQWALSLFFNVFIKVT